MFTVFFALAKPASTLAKPRFIKNTKIAARNTQRVSVMENEAIKLLPPVVFYKFSPAARTQEMHIVFIDKKRGRRRK